MISCCKLDAYRRNCHCHDVPIRPTSSFRATNVVVIIVIFQIRIRKIDARNKNISKYISVT